jgi:predicted nuclease of predicted toxin-antitoxin system
MTTSAPLLLRDRGHSVIDLRETGNEGADDTFVFEMAQERQATLLTTDRDFYHTVPHLYAGHYGVVVVALRQPNRRNIVS